MKEYEDWTNTGIWITLDHLFQFSSCTDISVRDLPKSLSERFRKLRRNRNYLLYHNAVLVRSEELNSASSRLLRMMRKEYKFPTQGQTYALIDHGRGRPPSFSIEIRWGEKVEITDMHGFDNKHLSDDMMLLAEKVRLPMPYKLKDKWVQEMKDYADKDWKDLDILANRDGKDIAWIEETFISGLRVSGYFDHLVRTRDYAYLKDMEERVSRRKSEAA